MKPQGVRRGASGSNRASSRASVIGYDLFYQSPCIVGGSIPTGEVLTRNLLFDQTAHVRSEANGLVPAVVAEGHHAAVNGNVLTSDE